MIEEKNNTVLSYNKPHNAVHQHNNIILILMIKNEEKIITRCLTSALPYVDGVAILDTGSTDNTIEKCKELLSTCDKPYKISTEPFKNFGYNRTMSFQKAVELCKELKWDPTNTYVMAIDADMNIVVSPNFKTYNLTSNGYKVIQKTRSLKYFNVRFMKCSHDWKCIGSTHEYWDGSPTLSIPDEIFYIDDKGDGGCKSDKFERDIRLLTIELEESSNNPRSVFYLAQSFKDLDKFAEAIPYYKKRIKLGGWYEEVWYSYYQIGRCYERLKDIHKMELWMNRAFNFHSGRAEPFYYMTRYFRENSQHYKAFHYYMKGKDIPCPKNDVLFIENGVYDGLFDYENTILACYVKNKSRYESLYDITSYINRNIPHHVNNVWDNIHYYIETLIASPYHGTYYKLPFQHFQEYNPSSCCVIPTTDGRILMNVRYVNYNIDNKGKYYIRSSDGNVKTRNGNVYLDSKFMPIGDIVMMKEDSHPTYPSNIEGLEDIRLFYFKNTLHFSASSKNVTPDNKVVIAVGEYHNDNYTISNVRVLEPPSPTKCEKNWTAVSETFLTHTKESKDKLNFIYDWHPLVIGAVNESNQLIIHTKYDTPTIFSRIRGSSPIYEFNNKLWCVVHHVRYSMPRVYYHYVVQFNRDTMKPEQYSLPFCFRNKAIEYCLGFLIKDDSFYFFFSENDDNPGVITIPMHDIRFLSI